jgi:hypothetical protein
MPNYNWCNLWVLSGRSIGGNVGSAFMLINNLILYNGTACLKDLFFARRVPRTYVSSFDGCAAHDMSFPLRVGPIQSPRWIRSVQL